ncbi:MAG: T9SS type A sorting domain-containing protein [Melioribacteraceae bacterium]|nr:T9SS type A sorting domain-containing protein [Melioribacteraceae bacterium]MCF8431124.1 T9SS type A sorting domain-containing protein [Melioribacteraceae bacterium]
MLTFLTFLSGAILPQKFIPADKELDLFAGLFPGDLNNSAPAFADLDNDSDLDLIVSVTQNMPKIIYFLNTGTAQFPKYELDSLKNPFDEIQSLSKFNLPSISFFDFDGDSDYDLIVGERDSQNQVGGAFYENIGTADSPLFSTEPKSNSFFQKFQSSQFSFVHIDSDSDKDLLVYNSNKTAVYENFSSSASPVFLELDTSDITGFNAPTNLKFNSTLTAIINDENIESSDRLVSVIEGSMRAISVPQELNEKKYFFGLIHDSDFTGNSINFYLFDHSANSAYPLNHRISFQADNINGTIANPLNLTFTNIFDSTSAVAKGDLNGNDLDDIIRINEYGEIQFLKNESSSDGHKFTKKTIPNLLDSVKSEIGYFPTLADLDADGDLDLVMGTPDGDLNLYFNGTTPLPVELKSFSASVELKSVLLKWQTVTEMNNYGFEVQKSEISSQNSVEKQIDWEKVGFVVGYGTTNSPQSYSFVDASPTAGKVKYRLKQIDFDGKYEYSETVEIDVTGPDKFELMQNYPNPFNPTTKIKFAISAALENQFTQTTLRIYNVLGEQVETLINRELKPGPHEIEFKADHLPSGIYFYSLSAGEFHQSRKMILLK